jgi:hypothetical protein
MLLLALGASCSDGNDTVPAKQESGPFAAFVDAVCGAARSCCERDGFGSQDLANCEAEFRRQTDLIDLIEGGTVTLTAAFVACTAAYRGAAASCVAARSEFVSCTNAMFLGTRAEGAPCTSALECSTGKGGWVCLKDSNAATDIGVCRQAPRARSGEGCFHTCDQDPCLVTLTTPETEPVLGVCLENDGLFCTGRVCAPHLAEGAPCSSGEACGPERYCSGVCTRRKAEAEPCAGSEECATLGCVNGRCETPRIANEKLCSGDLN